MNCIFSEQMMQFYKDKKVLVTGHTGFKGSWLCELLLMAGADVTGYALEPPTDPSLFTILGLDSRMHSVIGDIRDRDHLMRVFDEIRPQIVLHLAAQPIVRDSYKDPVKTYETNVMGTVNICEAVRLHPCVKSFLNVTTDKVYLNREWKRGYVETDPLDGYDPYSNSKSCSELVTHSYINSFYRDMPLAVSTARAGNVIGGGDFANDRIIPDCVRAAVKGQPIGVRNPYSTRPYQHVLEPISLYLTIAMRQYEDRNQYQGFYNVGPDDCDCLTTGELVTLFCDKWNQIAAGREPVAAAAEIHAAGGKQLPQMTWENQAEVNAPHEATFLKLDCSRIKLTFGWQPRWHIEEAVAHTVEWSAWYAASLDEDGRVTEAGRKALCDCTDRQIAEFIGR